MKNLDTIVEALPVDSVEPVEIDISEMIGEAPGTTVFVYADPTAAQLFQASKDGAKLAGRYQEMPTEMGAMVALLALSHVSPPSEEPRGLLYAKLAIKNRNLFLFLMSRFKQAFPHLADLQAAISQEKKP